MHPLSYPHPRTRAFSLAELLIAMGMLVIGLASVLAMFPMAAKLQREGADDALGRTTAQNVLAILRNARDVAYPVTTAPRLFTPLDTAGLTGLPDYRDVNDLYDYRLAYRRDEWDRVEVAVFVYRRDDVADNNPVYSAIHWADLPITTLDGGSPPQVLEEYPGLQPLALALNDQVMVQSLTDTRAEPIVVRVASATRVIPLLPRTDDYRFYYLPAGAVAIVTGVVR